MATVVLVGTLDTKGSEYAFLAGRIREHGVDVVLVDAGVMGEPLASPDVTREEVAAAAGVRTALMLVEADQGGMAAIARLVVTGRLRPRIAATFPLAEAAKAHALGETGHTAGKIVLVVR